MWSIDDGGDGDYSLQKEDSRVLNSDIRFSSSPNWYCPKVIDCDGNRLLAFGSRNSVVLLDIELQALRSRDSTSKQECVVAPVTIGILHRLHSERVSGLCFEFGVQTSRPLLATVGDDLTVNVVDIIIGDHPHRANDDEADTIKPIDERKCKYRIIGHHKEHKVKIAAVTWSTSANEMSSCVLSGDESGSLIAFNVASGKVITYKPHRPPVGKGTASRLTCVAACPSKPNLVAVGYQGGLIVVTDLRVNGEAMCLLRHHDDDIQSLCWAPFVGLGPLGSTFDRVVRTEECDDNLFVSGSKDRTFRIWSTKQGAPVRTFNLASNNVRGGGGGRRRTGDESGKVHPWLTTHWPCGQSHTLLAGSHFGDLLTFDLRNADLENNWSVVGIKEGKTHSRTIFNIITCKGVACTVSMDRQILFWDVDVEPSRWLLSIPTLGGYVYSLTFSPVNSGYLAIGCGDNVIRTWNTTSISNPYEVQTFWQGIKSKVTALSWHPRKEGLLAFGTIEGRVAVCNVLSNKAPSLSKNFHRNVVYTLTWGPVCPQTDDELGQWRLYSCGDGIVLVHDPNKLDKSALNLDKIISVDHPSKGKAPCRTDVAFKPDFSILVIGNDDGTVELYDAVTLAQWMVICAPRKLVQCIRWHPAYTTCSSTESTCRLWLAVASRDFTVHVHDLSEQLQTVIPVIPVQKKSSASFELAGHRAAVATIAWNPHRDGQLVSASFDGTVRVWNVVAMETMACFCGHAGRVLSAEWNPLDSDVVVSGGEDFTVRMWKVSEQPSRCERSVRSGKKTVEKSKAHAVEDEEEKEANVAVEAVEVDENVGGDVLGELKDLLEKRRQEIIDVGLVADNEEKLNGGESNFNNNSAPGRESSAERKMSREKPQMVLATHAQVNKKSGVSKKKKRAFKSMFPVSNSRENSGGKTSLLNDCVMLADHISGSQISERAVTWDPLHFGSDALLSLGAYGGRIDAYRLLKIEGEHHCRSDNDEYAMQLDLWKGNVAGVIRSAAARDQLTDWLLAMAPIVSHGFWEEMCGLFSKQLVTNGQPHKAVTFLLANQKVQEAIDVLRKNVSYKEAIILAKIRLSSDDPLIQELTEEWAAHMERDGQAEQAAKCHLSLGRVEKAATVLAQRQDAASLRTAAYVMRRASCADAPMLADGYAARAAFEFLVNDDHKMAEMVVNENQVLMPFHLVIETHGLVKGSLSKHEDRATTLASNWAHDDVTPETPLLARVHRKWLLDLPSFIEDSRAQDRIITLLSRDSFPAHPLKKSQMAAYLATRLTQTLIFALKSQFEDALRLLLRITVVLHRIGDANLLVWLFGCVLPNLDGSQRDVFSFLNFRCGPRDEDDASLDTSIQSLRAYRDLTILQEIVNRMKLLPIKTTQELELDVQKSLDAPSSCRHEMTALVDKLLSTVLTGDQSDVANLRLHLNNLKTTVVALVKKLYSLEVPIEREGKVDDTCHVDVHAQFLVDVILECSNQDVNRIEAEATYIRNRIEELSRILTAVWNSSSTSRDSFRSHLVLGPLLVVCLAFLAEREYKYDV